VGQLSEERREPDALAPLEEFARDNPSDPLAHFTLGDSLYQKYSADYQRQKADDSDLKLSLLHLSKAIELNPVYAEAYSQRGVVRSVLGDREGAKQDYDQAIEINPRYDRAFFNRGYWFEQQHRYSEAIADYERCIVLSTNTASNQDVRRRIENLHVKERMRRRTVPSELVL
jgi:tetratricopeptide (TPR) repeat protein